MTHLKEGLTSLLWNELGEELISSRGLLLSSVAPVLSPEKLPTDPLRVKITSTNDKCPRNLV